MTIKINKIIIFITYLIFVSSCFVFNNLAGMLNFSILHMLLTICFIKSCCKNDIKIIVVYLFIMYVFNCGQIYNVIYGNDRFNILPFTNYGTEDDIVMAFRFYIWFVSVMSVSIVYFLSNSEKTPLLKIKNNNENIATFGRVLICIGMGPRLYVDLNYLYIGLRQGYVETFNMYIPQVMMSLAFMFEIGMVALLIAYREKIKQVRKILVMITIYELIVMLSGHRYHSVVFLIGLFSYYYTNIEKLNTITVLKIGICSFILMGVLNTISSFRSSVDGVGSDEFFNSLLTFSNVIYQALGEYGSAFSSLVIVINQIGDELEYGFGLSYLMSLVTIVPGLSLLFPIDITSNAFYITKLQNATYLGGNIIGECYFNFGVFGIVFAVFWGKMLSACQKAIAKDNVFIWQKLFYIVVFIEMLACVRGYISMITQLLIILYLSIVYFNRCIKKCY